MSLHRLKGIILGQAYQLMTPVKYAFSPWGEWSQRPGNINQSILSNGLVRANIDRHKKLPTVIVTPTGTHKSMHLPTYQPRVVLLSV